MLLVITGANVTDPDLQLALSIMSSMKLLTGLMKNVTSTLCSCLATHAVLEFKYKQKRSPIGKNTGEFFPIRLLIEHIH